MGKTHTKGSAGIVIMVLTALIIGVIAGVFIGAGANTHIANKEKLITNSSMKSTTEQPTESKQSSKKEPVQFDTQKPQKTSVTTRSTPTNKQPSPTRQQGKISECGFTVNSPASGSSVSFPLSIEGTIDYSNQQQGQCNWIVFEGQAGEVEIIDQNGNKKGTALLSIASENWRQKLMNQQPVHVTASVSLSGQPYNSNLTLMFSDNQQTSQATQSTLSVPVIHPIQ